MSIDDVNEKITLKSMTNWVKERYEKYYFVNDIIDFNENIPLDNNEYNHFIYLISNLTDDEIYNVNALMNIYNKIPDESVLIDALSQYEKLLNDDEIIGVMGKIQLHQYSYEQLVNTKEKIEILKRNIIKFKANGFEKILYYCDDNKYFEDLTKELCKKLDLKLKTAWKLINNVYFKNIKIPKDINIFKLKDDFDAYFKDILKFKTKKFILNLKNPCRSYILKRCTVNGMRINEGADINVIYDYIKLKVLEQDILSIWNNYARKCDLKELEKLDIEKISFIEGQIKHIKNIIKYNQNYRMLLINDFRKYVCDELPLDKISKVKNVFLLDKLVMLQLLEKYLCNLKRLFFSCNCTEKLCTYMGNYEYDKIKKHYIYISKLKEKEEEIRFYNILSRRLQKSMPKFYEEIKKDNSMFIGIDFEELFNYAKFSGVLNGKIKSAKYENILKIKKCC